MTTPLDLSEFLDAYLAEADEHLANANAHLLAIEANLRRSEPIARQVRELFRALHTIKGLSAMVGVDPIVAIAHRMETVLRDADRSGGRLAKGAVDLLLEATRAIEQRIRALRSGTQPMAAPAVLLDALDALEAPQERAPAPVIRPLALDAAVAAKLAPFEHEAISRAVASGRRAVSVRFAPSTALAAAGSTIDSVRETLGTLAEIVKVVPLAVPPGPDAPAGLVFLLIALTAASDVQLALATGVAPTAIVLVAAPPEVVVTLAPAKVAEEVSIARGMHEEDEEVDVRRTGAVRVDVARLDDALERLSVLIISRSHLVREIARLAERGVDTRSLASIAREQSRQLRDLRASILGLRMVPLTEVLDRVPLIVRGLRRTTGKTVRLEIDVGRAELDKAVAERIFPAIIHLIRNAVGHGIETQATRVTAGKSDEGTLRISCAAVGNAQLELRISDDGRGIDRVELARRAGTAVPESEVSVLHLLCRPGLSTRDQVDATSGRGMGMDIVWGIVVDQLGGQLTLQSEPGRGTTFVLRVPLTISIVDAFIFECGSQRFAVPLSTVEEIVELDPASVSQGPKRARSTTASVGVFERRGVVVSVIRLDAELGLEAAPSPDAVTSHLKGLIVRAHGESIAFVVDRMLGQQEIVVRPLADPLLQVTGIAGATDLGDGRPTLIIDLLELAARHLGVHAAMAGARPVRRALEHST